MKVQRMALAIRPYGSHVKELVFKALGQAGISVEAPEDLLEASNKEIIERLQARQADVLLIPFNVQRVAGERTNGMELLGMIREQVSWAERKPAIMPISVFAKVAFEPAARKNPDPLRYPLFEDELMRPELPQALADFCANPIMAAMKQPPNA